MGQESRPPKSWRFRWSWEIPLLLLILVLGALLRLYGLNWDDGHWLHPDERQIYFVVIGLGWPGSLAEALSPGSPLNPGFFAYGSFPLYLLKIVAALLAFVWPALHDPDNLHLAGRPLAVLFDLGTVYLTYRLARTLWLLPRKRGGLGKGDYGRLAGLAAAALVSLAVLHVQLAHFYTADPILVFLVMLTLNLAVGVTRCAGRRWQVALGVVLGLALATKVSAVLLVCVVFAAYYVRGTEDKGQGTGHRAQETKDNDQGTGYKAEGSMYNEQAPAASVQWSAVIRSMIVTVIFAGVVFVVVQPYAAIDWRTFVADTVHESQIAWGSLDMPYTRQYAGTLPYLYPMWQTALWGLGLPLGLAAWAGFGAVLVRWLRRGRWTDTLLLAWAGPYLAITGAFYAKYLRYMLPLVPILCLVVAWGLAWSLATLRRRHAGRSAYGILGLGYWVLGVGVVLYAVAFVSMYAERHPWVSASEWIYGHVPVGSTLGVEEWDVALPLPLDVDGQPRRIEEYDVRTLPLYDEPDDEAKWQALALELADSDYLIVASRRLYGSIPRMPDRYPVASRYYEQLFSGELGFELAREFTRGPGWLNPRQSPLPDAAPALFHPDESFAVYDHPRALDFSNAEGLSAGELLRRLE